MNPVYVDKEILAEHECKVMALLAQHIEREEADRKEILREFMDIKKEIQGIVELVTQAKGMFLFAKVLFLVNSIGLEKELSTWLSAATLIATSIFRK